MKRYVEINKRVYDFLAEEYANNRDYYSKTELVRAKPFIASIKTNPTTPRVLVLG